MAERNPMTAVNDTVTIDTPRGGSSLFSFAIGSKQSDGTTAIDATSAVVLEYSWNGVDYVTPIKFDDPVAGTRTGVSLVGPNKAGSMPDLGSAKARLRCTVVVGNIPVVFRNRTDTTG
jgi:hypothetical protein